MVIVAKKAKSWNSKIERPDQKMIGFVLFADASIKPRMPFTKTSSRIEK